MSVVRSQRSWLTRTGYFETVPAILTKADDFFTSQRRLCFQKRQVIMDKMKTALWVAVLSFAAGGMGLAGVTVANPDFDNAAALISSTSASRAVTNASYGKWTYHPTQYTYNSEKNVFALDFSILTGNTGNRLISQMINTSATDTRGNYQLVIGYDAVDNGGATRPAALLYRIVGINNPGSLIDNLFSDRMSYSGQDQQGSVDNDFWLPTQISPAGTSILSGYVNLVGANVKGAFATITFNIPENYDALAIAVSPWAMSTGDELTLNSINIIPEPGTVVLLAFGGALAWLMRLKQRL
jgi:hypothetical protein